jgi:uncharacterized delta-60 repeat protein
MNSMQPPAQPSTEFAARARAHREEAHMRALVRAFCIALALIAATCDRAGHAITPDGYYDPTWPGSGHFAFNGDSLFPANASRAGTVIVESNGNLFMGGPAIGATDYWWIGELSGNGQFVSTFGANSAGRITSCQLGFTCAANNTWLDSALAQPGTYLTLSNSLALTTQAAHSISTSVGNPVTVNDSNGWVVFDTTTMQPDGKVLAAGKGFYSISDTTQRFGVARFSSGLTSIDHNFNAVTDNGGVTFDGGVIGSVDNTDTSETVGSVLVRPDGRIVLVGIGVNTAANSSSLELMQLNADGSPDATFGSNGVSKLSTFSSVIMTNVSAVLDRAGRLFVVVWVPGDFNGDGHGTLIGTDGKEIWSVRASPCAPSAFPTAAAFDSAGRVLIAGTCHMTFDQPTGYYFFVQRYRGFDGKQDGTFGNNSLSLGGFSDGSTADLGNAMVLDGGGRPVIVGATFTQPSVQARAGIARLTYDLVYTNDLEAVPRGCLPPDCN